MKHPSSLPMAAVQKAQASCMRQMKADARLLALEASAGFVTDKDGEGLQVFVKAYRYSEQLFQEHPDTGGLVELAPPKWRPRR